MLFIQLFNFPVLQIDFPLWFIVLKMYHKLMTGTTTSSDVHNNLKSIKLWCVSQKSMRGTQQYTVYIFSATDMATTCSTEALIPSDYYNAFLYHIHHTSST